MSQKAYNPLNIPDHKCECNRCFGTGRLGHFAHVERGICFQCRGSGLMWDGTFKAKFDSRCKGCGCQIRVGDHVRKNDSARNFEKITGVVCIKCA